MRYLAIILFFCLNIYSANCQTEENDTTKIPENTSYWTRGATNLFTLSQVSLFNWSAGGLNSTALNFNVNLFADYIHERITWQNTLELGYGLVKQGENKFSRSDDKINLVTQFGYQIINENNKWFFSGLLDFRTQFNKGLDSEGTKISAFMAPGYLLIGSGIDYKPNEFLSLSYTPFTGKFTFVLNQFLANNGSYGVTPATFDDNGTMLIKGKKARAELGSFLKIHYTQGIYEGRLELFSNYIDNFGNIDINWQNQITAKLNKFLTFNFFFQLIYDDDIKIGVDDNDDNIIEVSEEKPRIQMRNVLGIGLTYQLGDNRVVKK